jgi:YfiR/HmsC-like
MVTLLAVASALTVSVPSASAQRDEVGEYELKAAILFNLSKFVEWPPSAYADSQAPTVVCILGQDPFGDSLKALGQKQDASGRPVSIRRPKNGDESRDCHVLYISSSERKTLAQTLSRLKGSSVLTVGEMSQFAAQGGIVQFTLEDKQVHFQINLDAASRMTLKISSRLLVLARIVKDQRHNSDSGGLAAAAPVASASAPDGETLANSLGERSGSRQK